MSVVGPPHDPRAHFHSLSRLEQAAAIRRLAAEGIGEYSIAYACGLAVEQVRAVLAEREHGPPKQA